MDWRWLSGSTSSQMCKMIYEGDILSVLDYFHWFIVRTRQWAALSSLHSSSDGASRQTHSIWRSGRWSSRWMMSAPYLIFFVAEKIVSLILADETQTLLSHALGVMVVEASEELGFAHGCSIKLEWLWLRFQGVTDTSGQEVIRRSIRAYLLYLLECTLFTDKTGSWVSVDYFHYLEDLDSVYTYAWGANEITYLYR